MQEKNKYFNIHRGFFAKAQNDTISLILRPPPLQGRLYAAQQNGCGERREQALLAPSVRELAIADFRQLTEGEILFSSC